MYTGPTSSLGASMKATLPSPKQTVRPSRRARTNKILATCKQGFGLQKAASRCCERSHHKPNLPLLGSLPPATPTCGPDFASHLCSRNCVTHEKTLHQVQLAMHTFYHFFGGKVFKACLPPLNLITVCGSSLQYLCTAASITTTVSDEGLLPSGGSAGKGGGCLSLWNDALVILFHKSMDLPRWFNKMYQLHGRGVSKTSSATVSPL